MDWKRVAGGTLKYFGKGQIIKGDFHATSAGYGLKVDANRTWIERGNADDGGVIITSTGNAYLFGSRRLLMKGVQTGDNSWFGGCDRLSINASQAAVTGEMGAHWAMLECKAAGVIGSSAGNGCYRADININTSGDIGTGKIASCFLAACESVGTTHTGEATVMDVRNPQVGTFDYFATFGSAPGGIAANTHSIDSHALSYIIKIKDPAGNAGYIPVLASVPS